MGKLGEEEDEKDPATELRSECTYLGLDLGEREEQVSCHASALALAMTDKARREAEIARFGQSFGTVVSQTTLSPQF